MPLLAAAADGRHIWPPLEGAAQMHRELVRSICGLLTDQVDPESLAKELAKVLPPGMPSEVLLPLVKAVSLASDLEGQPTASEMLQALLPPSTKIFWGESGRVATAVRDSAASRQWQPTATEDAVSVVLRSQAEGVFFDKARPLPPLSAAAGKI